MVDQRRLGSGGDQLGALEATHAVDALQQIAPEAGGVVGAGKAEGQPDDGHRGIAAPSGRGGGRTRRRAGQMGGEGGDGGKAEDVAGRNLPAGQGRQPGLSPRHQQRGGAGLEQIGLAAGDGAAQQPGPNFANGAFQPGAAGRTGAGERACGRRGLGGGQGLAVDLGRAARAAKPYGCPPSGSGDRRRRRTAAPTPGASRSPIPSGRISTRPSAARRRSAFTPPGLVRTGTWTSPAMSLNGDSKLGS